MTRDTASRIARSIGAAAMLTSTVALFAAPAQARVAPDDPPTASSSQHSTKTQIEYQERTGASGSTDPFTTLHQAERAARRHPSPSRRTPLTRPTRHRCRWSRSSCWAASSSAEPAWPVSHASGTAARWALQPPDGRGRHGVGRPPGGEGVRPSPVVLPELARGAQRFALHQGLRAAPHSPPDPSETGPVSCLCTQRRPRDVPDLFVNSAQESMSTIRPAEQSGPRGPWPHPGLVAGDQPLDRQRAVT